MRQKDTEKYAFLYLCGKRDRELLLGKQKMKFPDFERLLFLTEYLGLGHCHQEIWNTFAEEFAEPLARLEKIQEESWDVADYDPCEDDETEKGRWLEEFLKNAPGCFHYIEEKEGGAL